MKYSIKHFVFLCIAMTTGLFSDHKEDVLRFNGEKFLPEEYKEFQEAYAYQSFLTYKLECASQSKISSSKEDYLKGFDFCVAHKEEDTGVYPVELMLSRPYEAFTNGFFAAQTLIELEWRTTPFKADYPLVRQELEKAFDGALFVTVNSKFKKTEIVYKVALENHFDSAATRKALQDLEWDEQISNDLDGDTYELEKMRFNKMFGHSLAKMVKWLNKDRKFPLIDGASFAEGLEHFNINATNITSSDIRQYLTIDDSSDENIRKEMSYAIGGGMHLLIRSSNCVYFDNYVIARQFSESLNSDVTLGYEKEYNEKYRELYRSHTTSELALAIKMKKLEKNND